MKFKLESVLSLKKNIEDDKKRELTKVHTKRRLLERETSELQNALTHTIQTSKQAMQNQIDPNEMIYRNRFTKYVQKEISLKEKQKTVIANEIDIKTKELVEAVKGRKILDNLKKVHQTRYNEELKRQEQSLVDQLVSYQYTVKKRGGTDG
jgi:flagellar FliJ protein